MLKAVRSGFSSFVCVGVAVVCLVLLTGCDPTSGQTLCGGLSASSTELASFVPQFAREALAAFLL